MTDGTREHGVEQTLSIHSSGDRCRRRDGRGHRPTRRGQAADVLDPIVEAQNFSITQVSR
jgi:hypothetical protein